jgi:hypothetical protein
LTQRFGFSAARSVLSYVRDNADRLFICTTAPATYSAASNQPQLLVSANVTADEWTLTSGAQGPAITFNSRTLTIEGSGSASHLVFARSSGSTILALTDVCAGTVFTSGNTVTLPAWRTEIVGGDVFRLAAASQGETVAAPTIFSPNQLSLLGWYAEQVTVTAGRVAQWTDKSGNATHLIQVSASAMPIHVSAVADLNSRNALRWQSNFDTMLTMRSVTAAVCAIGVSGLAPWSGAMVFENSAVAGVQTIFHVNGVTAGTSRQFRTSAGRYQFREVGAATSVQDFGSSKTTPVVLRWQWTSGRASAWENGVQILTSAKVSANDNNNAGSWGSPIISIGQQADISNTFTGHIAELLFAATAWSSSQGRELDKLLGAKYGITIT